MQLQVGSVVKPNPTLFKPEMKPWDHVGKLGFPALFKDFAFKITEIFTHSYHGNLARCEGVNIKLEAPIVLMLDELVFAAMKTTVDYEILDMSKATKAINQQIKSLEYDIKLAIASGKYKPEGRKVTGLRKQIADLQATLATQEQPIFLKKFKRIVSVPSSVVADTKQLEMELAARVRAIRSEFKTIPKETKKKVFNQYDVTMVGGIHIKPNVYGEIFEKSLIELIDKPKVPSSPTENYLGIEIECLIREDSSKLLKELLCKQRLHKNVQMGSDSSIQADTGGYKGIELRVLVTESELQSVMARLSKCLKHRKVDAYVNRSCGLHVHLDMRNRDHMVAFQKLFRVQTLLRNSQSTSRLVSTYCKEVTEDNFKDAQDRGERYSVINTVSFKKHGTLEIRVHDGTVNTKDITNWCMFLTGVLASNITTKITDVEMLRGSAVPSTAIDYIKNRIEEFNSEVA